MKKEIGWYSHADGIWHGTSFKSFDSIIPFFEKQGDKVKILDMVVEIEDGVSGKKSVETYSDVGGWCEK